MGMRHRAYKRRQAAKRRQGADRFDERARALVAAGAFEPIAWPRALVVVGVLTAGAVAALSIAWPLAVVAALIAIRLDRTEEAPFALHRAATLVGIERSAPRRGWRRYLPLERAGPDVVLSRPLNGVLLLAVIASFALVFVNLTLLTLTAVLLAAYACVGRPERAWVPKHAVRTLRSLADQAPDQVAAPMPASAPVADPVAPAASAATKTPAPAARRDRLPTTGPAIVAEIDALARGARPSIPPEAMAAIGRIRELAAQALPTHDRDLNFSDHETWLVRQVACDYLPAAIEGYRAIDPQHTTRPLADGRSARQVLTDSLALIERFLRDAEMAAWERDVDALLTHERFLADRFAASSSFRADRVRQTDEARPH